MATYAELTDEQKARCEEYVTLARPLAGELARLLNKLESLDGLWNNDISAIMAALTNGEDVPNPTGLSGAAAMTDLDHVTLHSYFQGVLGYNTAAHRGNYVQAAGAVNTFQE